ncbi:MAG: hypothetical protein A9183_06880 [Dehalococcoides mccartyi]|uniref:hypothetical protein n=1 Tax=Dehalococcoides mccartyi TaxID=61435 RepID=UPI000805BEE4|nr:hypothetical protein [Dehalococcoides mccartyi]OBW62610.1 MAG: hypothetical protein A9183_06880 [Dehalococcoides mccartyi]
MKRILKIVGSIFGGLMLVGLILTLTGNNATTPTVYLNADVTKSYGDLIIYVQNNDTADWTDVKIELNSGYTCHLTKIAAGTTVQIEITDFITSDGTKFQPSLTAPIALRIVATFNGKTAYYSGTWD